MDQPIKLEQPIIAVRTLDHHNTVAHRCYDLHAEQVAWAMVGIWEVHMIKWCDWTWD